MAINSLRPLKAEAFDYWHAQHLLNRAGFGGTPAQVRTLAGMGLDGAVDYIVDFEKVAAPAVEASDFDKDIVRPANEEERADIQAARRNGDEAALERYRQEVQRRQQADRQQVRRMQVWWMKRMIETPRPLEEKLTLFWHGHFATGYRSIEDSYHMFLQNQFFRANAAGNFADLVYGIIRDPAMLAYLNNNQNNKARPNENLARELMELFTLGEGHDYTERDIKEGARALTGYAFEDDEFVFRAQQHDDEEKTIFGKTSRWDGADFCKLILSRPVCSQYICWKLYRFFVNDMPGDPDEGAQGFIAKLAREFRDHQYDMKPVLRTLFKSEHFYDRTNTASQVKSPVQLIVQAVRSLHTPVRSVQALVSAADLMGQNILFPPSVKGWDGGRAWINTSTIFVRQNLLIFLLTGRRPDQYEWETDDKPFDAAHMVEHLKPAPEQSAEDRARNVIAYMLRFNLGTEPHDDRVTQLSDYLRAAEWTIDNRTLVGLLALIAAMPEYQLC